MPMNPEHLPLLALLVAALFVGVVAIRDLLARRWIAALRAGAVAVAALTLGFVGGTRLGRHDKARISPLAGLVPVSRTTRDPAGTNLLLGGVSVSIVPQDRCVIAWNGTPFLTLDSLRTGVLLTCGAALPDDNEGPIAWRERGMAAWIGHNVVFSQVQGVQSSRPDPHTLVVRRGADEVLRVRFMAPGSVEIEGNLWVEGQGDSGRTISLRHGIRWPGGSIPAGPVDLTSQGEGMIVLQSNGAVRVIPERQRSRRRG
jgi:hypothetical protein